MKDFPLKIGIADLKNKIWLIQLTKICNPSFKMRIAHALIVGALHMKIFAVQCSMHCLAVNFPFFGNMMNTFYDIWFSDSFFVVCNCINWSAQGRLDFLFYDHCLFYWNFREWSSICPVNFRYKRCRTPFFWKSLLSLIGFSAVQEKKNNSTSFVAFGEKFILCPINKPQPATFCHKNKSLNKLKNGLILLRIIVHWRGNLMA